MSCYCGLGTTENKIRWLTSVVGLIVAIALFIAFWVVIFNTLEDYRDCLKDLKKEGKITSYEYNDAKDEYTYNSNEDNPFIWRCQKDHLDDNSSAGALFWISVVFFVVGTVPLYMMCCCTKKPEPTFGVSMPYIPPSARHGTIPTYAAQLQMTKV
eukprot:TRINITY_DN776_c0_g1_i9.p3 TRINITY_DN776_c0_g1~~TRINITY_DN776_c0_g1_i9.p3  ORF type:complete len:155 (-),score=9.96 TRINITY_DN776_c0_g1_i9:290-754(-)